MFAKILGSVISSYEYIGLVNVVHVIQGKHKDRMAGGAEEFNAFFYSLVSTDTQVSPLGASDP